MYPPFLVDFALSLIDSFYMCLPANIQPADHKSIEVEYWRDPINTSGARYHKVTTFFIVFIYTMCVHLSYRISYLVWITSYWNTVCSSKTKITQF
jgi:hypothetical protein